jgi:hypothetical protein
MNELIVFGRGTYYQHKKKTIKDQYKIVAYLDNSIKEYNTEVREDGVIVIPPDKIKEYPDVPILLASVHFPEMWKQLMELDINPDRIIFGIDIQPYFNEVEKKLQEWKYAIKALGDCITLENESEHFEFSSEVEYKEILRNIFAREDKLIKIIGNMQVYPISRSFGADRGLPLDRYYIENFLKANGGDIRGDVLEVAENTYTLKFGTDVTNSYILHVNGWGNNALKGNLETGEGIIENSIDCFICTQTIQTIYNLNSTIENVYKLLKHGGVSLITVSGLEEISMYDYSNWGEYWRFTEQSLKRLFSDKFGDENVQVESFGNVKIAMGIIYGLCVEDLKEEDFKYNDKQYQVVVTARVRKK